MFSIIEFLGSSKDSLDSSIVYPRKIYLNRIILSTSI